MRTRHPESFLTILKTLQDIGLYNVSWRLLNSKDHGVAHETSEKAMIQTVGFQQASRIHMTQSMEKRASNTFETHREIQICYLDACWCTVAWLLAFLDPPNRPRIYIIGLKTEFGKFSWPAKREPVALKDLLDSRPKNKVEYVLGGAHKQKNVLAARAKLINMGRRPDRTCAAVDVASSRGHVMANISPCLTASRASEGGFCLTSHRRHMKNEEMMRL